MNSTSSSSSSSSYYGAIEIGAAPPPPPAVFHQTFTAEDEEQLLLFPGNTAKRSGEVGTHLSWARASRRNGVVTGLFWVHLGVAVVLMVVLLGLVDLDHNETLTSTFTITLYSLSYELPPLYSLSALYIFIATVVSTVSAVFFAGLWMATSRRYPLFLIYLSIAMSPLSSLTLAAYSFYQGTFVLTKPIADKMVVGGMLVYVSVFVVVLFWTWRSRIPYAVELLRTTVVFLRDYPGPVRIAFVTLLPAVFWHYFTALGALLAVTCLESPALRFTAMGFYLASSIWAPAVISGLLRVISAGVCVVWYERDSPADDGGTVRSEPTRFFLRQSLSSSFNAVAVAAVLGFDLRTFRASFVAYRKLCCNFCGRVVAGIDRIIPYFNHYAYTQIATHNKPYFAAAQGTWDVLQDVSAVLDDNLLGALLPLSVTTVGMLSLIPGLVVTGVMEDDYYLLAGFLSYSSGCAVMAQVLQVIDSAAVTLILCFAEKPEILEAKYPLLHARFRSLCDPPPPDHPDNSHHQQLV